MGVHSPTAGCWRKGILSCDAVAVAPYPNSLLLLVMYAGAGPCVCGESSHKEVLRTTVPMVEYTHDKTKKKNHNYVLVQLCRGTGG